MKNYVKQKYNLVFKIRSATTLYRVVRDGIEKTISPYHERKTEFENSDKINEGDILYFSFGYVDIINNFLKYEQSTYKPLITNYVETIKKFCTKTKSIPIIQTDTIPQPSDLNHTHTGSLTDRIMLRNIIRNMILESCKEHNILIFEYTEKYIKNDGTFETEKTFSEDKVHIGHSAITYPNCRGCFKCEGDIPKNIWNSLLKLIDENVKI
jgi:hypothetical protein